MKFVYMVQTEGQLPLAFAPLTQTENTKLIQLTFQAPVPGAIFLPNSTWTEGRNALLAEAKRRGEFDYYIFCDDDIAFERGSFATFNQQLEALRPAVAAPLYTFAPNRHDEFSAHTIYAFDAIVNAFHADLIKDEIILPYFGKFDQQSWWYSQFFIIHLCSIFYQGNVLRLNDVCIRNEMHRPYPKNGMSDWLPLEEFLSDEVFLDQEFLNGRFRHHYLKSKEIPGEPKAPQPSYRLTETQKSKLKLDGQFWRR